MAITLEMRLKDPPGSWEEFIAKAPPYSIAIDGYLNEGPRFDGTGPWLNLDHHQGVESFATHAACGQALKAVRQDLFKFFSDDKGPTAQVFANHCDEDVCLTWFILNHCYLAEFAINPRLIYLVGLEDNLDSTAGAYPLQTELAALGELAWVFDPYRCFRIGGRMQYRNEQEFVQIVTDVGLRIEAYIAGRHESIPLDTRYKIIGGGREWVMIKEIGTNARTGLFNDGHRVYVSVRARDNGRFDHVLGRMSSFIPIPILKIATRLNEIEANTIDPWGISGNFCGSPRIAGSKIPPKEIEKIINEILSAQS